ncbi:MAG: hypothetical protein M3137_03815 [Actinomycetota bacterium]|nr:hypothetical protein [Actinomycetota bacterium]
MSTPDVDVEGEDLEMADAGSGDRLAEDRHPEPTSDEVDDRCWGLARRAMSALTPWPHARPNTIRTPVPCGRVTIG